MYVTFLSSTANLEGHLVSDRTNPCVYLKEIDDVQRALRREKINQPLERRQNISEGNLTLRFAGPNMPSSPSVVASGTVTSSGNAIELGKLLKFLQRINQGYIC